MRSLPGLGIGQYLQAADSLKDLGIDPANEGQGDEDTPRPPVLTSVSFAWELARPTDPDVAPREQRLLRAVGEALAGPAQPQSDAPIKDRKIVPIR